MTELFFDFVRDGRLNVKDLITHRHPPTEAPQVYEMLRTDRTEALGVIFDFTAL